MASSLPNRRVEAWKYTDLAAALPDVSLRAGEGAVIARLAQAVTVADVAAGETRVVVERFGDEMLDVRAMRAHVGVGATLVRVVIQPEAHGVALSHAEVSLEAGASFRQFIHCEGARLARHETDVTVGGEGTEIELNGLWLAGAGRHADLTSVVRHQSPRSTTRQLVKGVARAGGRGVFQGKILVAPQAQETDARQNHRALLLEDGAEVFAKPELEIHADDVQCAHGATVGGLDARTLFYMRARGIPEGQARALLTEAFVEEAVPATLPEGVHGEVSARLRAWLGGAA